MKPIGGGIKKIKQVSFIIFISVFTLILVEGFFRLNSEYQFISLPLRGANHASAFDERINQYSFDLDEKDYSRIKKSAPLSTYTETEFDEISKNKNNAVRFGEPKINLKKEIVSMSTVKGGFDIKTYLKLNDKTIFEKKYGIDELNRRKTIGSIKPSNKNILMIGCSFIFGEGVDDHETVPSHLSALTPNHNIYNLGISAGGLSQILDDIVNPYRLGDINRQQGGVVVYQYFRDHFRRHFSYQNYSADKEGVRNNFYRIEDGRLLIETRSDLGIKLKSFLFDVLRKSRAVQHSGILGYELSLNQQQEFVHFLSYVRDYYKKNYNLNFYFFIMSPADVPSYEFIKMLEEQKINFILYAGINNHFKTHEVTIPIDRHFTGFGNSIFAEVLFRALKQKNEL